MVRDACWLIVSALFLFVFFVRVIVKDLSFSYLFASHTRSCRGHSGIGRVLTALWVCADLGFFASSFFVCFVVPVVVVFSDRALAALKRQGVCRTWTSSCLRSRPTACFGGSMQWTGSCQTTSLDKEASPRLGSSDCSSSPTSRCEAPTAARVAVPETSPRGRRGLREGGLWWRASSCRWLVGDGIWNIMEGMGEGGKFGLLLGGEGLLILLLFDPKVGPSSFLCALNSPVLHSAIFFVHAFGSFLSCYHHRHNLPSLCVCAWEKKLSSNCKDKWWWSLFHPTYKQPAKPYGRVCCISDLSDFILLFRRFNGYCWI